MVRGYENKQLILNTDMNGRTTGQIIDVKYQDGEVVNPFWRKRVKEAEKDNCVEFVKTKKVKKTKKKGV